ncbi:MAG TPA: hypothetical protein VK612_03625 [Pyrinomonadaceae bacterium]|nr:hypothetical protein [Pyrinomonadaceae bacterium]
MRKLKQFFNSKLGWTAVAVHLIAVAYSFWGDVQFEGECGPFSLGAGWVVLAGKSMHWFYEPILLKTLLLVDLLALGLAEAIADIFGAQSLCYLPRSWVIALLGLFFASIQWYIVGKVVGGIISVSAEDKNIS